MAGEPGADDLIVRGRPAAARIAGGDFLDALHVLEHGIDAPETTAGKDRGLVLLVRCGGRSARPGRESTERDHSREQKCTDYFAWDICHLVPLYQIEPRWQPIWFPDIRPLILGRKAVGTTTSPIP